MSPAPYYGKYRGTVVQNIDPLQLGRVIVDVPEVLGNKPSAWAMPCVPVAGIQSGCFLVPPIGSSVWIEFEQGKPDYPIWTGGFWPNAASLPAAANPQTFVIETAGQTAIVLSDANGLTLKSPTGASIVLNKTGIYLNNGKGATVSLIGPSVTIQGLHH